MAKAIARRARARTTTGPAALRAARAALVALVALVSLLGATLRATPFAGLSPLAERSEISRSSPEERDPALHRQRDAGRVTSLRASSDGGPSGRTRAATPGVLVPALALVVPRAQAGESRARVAQRVATPRARTRAELMVFLN